MRALATGNTGNLVLTGIMLAALRLVGSVLLTRLLPTDAFGTMAIVSSVAVTFGLLLDLGIVAFVVRHEGELTRELLDEVWTIRLIYGLGLCMATVAASIPIANALAKPELAMPIAVGGLTFVFGSLDSLALASMLRKHRVKRLNAIEVGAQMAALFACIVLAIVWRNFWALIVGGFVGQIVRAGLTYVFFEDQARRFVFSRSRVEELWKFSRYISMSTFLTLLVTQCDKFILGRIMSLGSLGLYNIAINIASVPLNIANQYSEKITFPRVSDSVRFHDDDVCKSFYAHMSIALLMMCGAAVCIGLSKEIVEILYPDSINGAATYLQIAMVGIIFSINNSRINHLMIALSDSRFTLEVNIVRATFLVGASVVGYYVYGALGVIWAFSLVEVSAQIFGWWRLRAKRLLRVRYEAMILGAVIASFAAGVVLAQMSSLASMSVEVGRAVN